MELLVGAIIGVVVERLTKVFEKTYITLRHWPIGGEYSSGTGTVIIRRGFGNHYKTESKETNPTYNWTGSLQLEESNMRTGRGYYRYVERKNDWGYHYIMLLNNGDISVPWENMSASNRNHVH